MCMPMSVSELVEFRALDNVKAINYVAKNVIPDSMGNHSFPGAMYVQTTISNVASNCK